MSEASPIPLTLLTGFLGAGKTTVLNRILAGDHGLRVAVMVNDFGDLDIDEELVSGRADGTLRLTNGCICCSLKEGLVEAVMGLFHRDPPPEHIVLEASGVADPTGIATTLLAPVFGGRVRLDGVLCLVDAEHFASEHGERDLILRQLMVSDLILLNKIDRLDEAALSEVEGTIRGWLSKARILRTVHGDAPLAVLLSSMRSAADALLASDEGCPGGACEHPEHRPHAAFDTWQYQTPHALCPDALKEAARALPPAVYRLKGRVRLATEPPGDAILSGVGRRLDIQPRSGRPEALRESRLVVIGAEGSLDAAWLHRTFESCARSPESDPEGRPW